MENNAKLYTQNESKINGREVWHYLLDSPIGQIHVVGYENPRKEITRFLIDSDINKAIRKYGAICKGIIAGRI
jgi:hypothetical protein